MESAGGGGASGEEDRGEPRSIVVKAHCLSQAMKARLDAVEADWLGDDGVPDEIDVDLTSPSRWHPVRPARRGAKRPVPTTSNLR